MKECVERAAKKGVSLGLHTLTNFTTTNDAYVTPVPDPRLKKMIPVRLLESVDEKQPEIRVDRAGGFLYEATLNCFQIGDELLQYSSCEQEGEGLVLKDCVRGALDVYKRQRQRWSAGLTLIQRKKTTAGNIR